MRAQWYILQDRKPVAISDMAEWAKWLEKSDRHVDCEYVTVSFLSVPIMRSWVSTVFLGLDHSHLNSGPPILFESMVFGGPLGQECQRCSTWEEAERQHAALCDAVKATPITLGWMLSRLRDYFDRAFYRAKWKLSEVKAFVQLGAIIAKGHILKIQNRLIQFYLDKTK